MQTDHELLSCPFCSSKPTPPTSSGGGSEVNGYNFRVTISCTGCGATISRASHESPSGWCDDKGQAHAGVIAAWNRRAAASIASQQTDKERS